MKKIISLFLTFVFVCTYVQAATYATAVAKYKAGNYTGCINDLDEIADSMDKNKDDINAYKKILSVFAKYDLKKWISGNVAKTEENAQEAVKISKEVQKIIPKSQIDKFAHLFYYYALCLHQLGYKEQAKQFYAVVVFFTYENPSDLYKYSYQAYNCIEKPNSCKSSDMEEFIESGKQVSDDIIRDQLKKDLKRHQDNINAGKGLSWLPNKEDKIAWADDGIIPEVNEIGKNEVEISNVPTDEEVGRAVRTLQRAGINPMAYMNPMANNEYAQLNALLNNGNNNYYNDYSTLMMNNGNGQISPELMQTIMRQQMMGGFGSF